MTNPNPTPMPMSAELVPIAKIKPSPDNPRSDLGDLTGLAASITRDGLLHPIIVRKPTPRAKTYQVVSGHRRLAAAEIAGLSEIKAFIATVDDAGAQRLGWAENLWRADITLVDRAKAAAGVVDSAGSQALAAELLGGISQATVSMLSAVASLPAIWSVIDELAAGTGPQPGIKRSSAFVGVWRDMGELGDDDQIAVAFRHYINNETNAAVSLKWAGLYGKAATPKRGRPRKTTAPASSTPKPTPSERKTYPLTDEGLDRMAADHAAEKATRAKAKSAPADPAPLPVEIDWEAFYRVLHTHKGDPDDPELIAAVGSFVIRTWGTLAAFAAKLDESSR